MEIEKVLDAEGVRGAVRYLNSSVPHHDPAVYEITEQILHNLYIFDKLNPKLKPIEDTPISESYCELVLRTSAPVKIVNAWADVMTRSHNAFPKAKAYCRYPLRIQTAAFAARFATLIPRRSRSANCSGNN